MTTIAEAYFHLRPFSVDQENINALGNNTSRIARELARGVFPEEAEIEVRLSAGSLKGWAAIIVPVLMGSFDLVANYKSFKENIPIVVHDAQQFSENLVDKFIAANVVKPSVVYRRERRTKTPGKILRVLKRREWLESHRAQLRPEQINQFEASIETLTQQVLDDLAPSEREIVRNVLAGGVEGPPEPADTDVEPDCVAIKAEIGEQLPLLESYADHGPPPVSDFYARFRVGDLPKQNVKPSLVTGKKISGT